MEEIIVRIIDFGTCAADAVTIKDSADDFNVYLNARISPGQQRDALEHELEHIRKGHFWDERPVHEIENDIEKGKAVHRTAR